MESVVDEAVQRGEGDGIDQRPGVCVMPKDEPASSSSSSPKQDKGRNTIAFRVKVKVKGCPVDIIKCEEISQGVPQYELLWNGGDDQLKSILKWFQDEVKPLDPAALLAFSSMSSQGRAEIHNVASKFNVWTTSHGVRNTRSVSVYTNKAYVPSKKGKRIREIRQESRRILLWIRDNYGNVPADNPYSNNEVYEMLATRTMTEDFKEMYDVYKRASQIGHKKTEKKTPKKMDIMDGVTDIEFVQPEDGTMGHFFINKLACDAETLFEFPNLGLTKVMNFDELVPLEDLQSVLITTDAWFNNSHYVSKYFPKSVDVTVVCPSRFKLQQPIKKTLIDCPEHRRDYTKLSDVTGELRDVECGCPETRRIMLIHPKEKVNAKLMIARYSSHAHIAIGSASFDNVSWEKVGQFGWFCDLPMDTVATSDKIENCDVGFGRTLLNFLACLCPDLIEFLQGIVLSRLSPTVQLVSSVPGAFPVRGLYGHHYGFSKLGALLHKIPWPKGSKPALLYQTPVVGYERRLFSLLTLLNNMFDTKYFTEVDMRKPWDWLHSKLDRDTLKILFPCVSHSGQVTTKYQFTEGLRNLSHGNGLIELRLFMAENDDPFFGKIIWNSRIVCRLCNVKDADPDKGTHRYGWLFVGSYDLSNDNWGEVFSNGQYIRCRSYELGVLHRPCLVDDPIKGTKYIAPDFVHITLPFREDRIKSYPCGAYPVSLLREPPTGPVSEEPDHASILIGRFVPGQFNQSRHFIRPVAEPTNEEEAKFFRDHEMARWKCDVWHSGLVSVSDYVIRNFQAEFHKPLRPGMLLAFIGMKRNIIWKCYWVLDVCETRSEMVSVGDQKSFEDNKPKSSASFGGSHGDDEVKGDWDKKVQIPKIKFYGMKVIGLDVDARTLTKPRVMPKLVRPEPRDAYIKRLLSDVYGINTNKRESLRGPTSIHYRKCVLKATKKRFLIT